MGGNIIGLVVVAAMALWPVALPRARRARIWHLEAFWYFVATGAFIALFIIGETMTDPGGAEALGLIAAWLIPAGLLVWQALVSPRSSEITLIALAAIVNVLAIWAAVSWDTWRRFEDEHGPLRDIGAFALTIPLVFLARKREITAGWLLVATSTIPSIALLATRPYGGPPSFNIITSPALTAGLLFLLAGYYRRAHPEPVSGELPPIPPPGA